MQKKKKEEEERGFIIHRASEGSLLYEFIS
jgi:hypothetical protein